MVDFNLILGSSMNTVPTAAAVKVEVFSVAGFPSPFPHSNRDSLLACVLGKCIVGCVL